MSDPLVSVICAAWNAERTIAETIRSVLAQELADLELLIGDDGSTDGTAAVVASFNDPRIRYHALPHRGVAEARNALLQVMRGRYFCFVDSDDVLPPRSLASRAAILGAKPSVGFADGRVELRDATLEKVVRHWSPSASGDPVPHLLALDGRAFLGNTWMVRRVPGRTYRFEAGLTHGEDLLFYLSIADGAHYAFTSEVVLWYRRSAGSAMSDLRGLEEGYATIYRRLCSTHLRTIAQRVRFKLRIMRIMGSSHLKDGGSPLAAVKAIARYVFLRSSSSKTRA